VLVAPDTSWSSACNPPYSTWSQTRPLCASLLLVASPHVTAHLFLSSCHPLCLYLPDYSTVGRNAR